MTLDPLRRLARAADDVLRGRSVSAAPRTLGRLAGLVLACGLIYGGVMGSFGSVAGDRPWRVAFSAVKVPLLLLATFGLVLPSFFVLNTLLGLRADFPRALRAVLGSQAALAIGLASLAPFTAFWYVNSDDYPASVLFNAAMFGVATLGAQGPLRRAYRPLIARDRRHRVLLRGWMVLYAFVGIQLGWLLRPFIGDPTRPIRFFRGGAWENAYVIVSRMIWSLIHG